MGPLGSVVCWVLLPLLLLFLLYTAYTLPHWLTRSVARLFPSVVFSAEPASPAKGREKLVSQKGRRSEQEENGNAGTSVGQLQGTSGRPDKTQTELPPRNRPPVPNSPPRMPLLPRRSR